MSIQPPGCHFAVIGGGPYGLAVASHLRAAGVEVRVFGRTMEFWDRQMPRGMLLRSPWNGSHIADPARGLTLDRYEAAQGRPLSRRLPLEDFVGYGQWFQRQALPDLDPRMVVRVEQEAGGFRLSLEDDDGLRCRRVIVATGIGSFAHRPEPFASLPIERASHTSDRVNQDLGRFAGRRVVVIGGGQSAIESAALLDEAGAEVEVLIREPQVRWLRSRPFVEWLMDSKLYPFKAPGKIGPMGINWLIEHPPLFTLFPRKMQDWMARRSIRPMASSWLRPRTTRVTISTGRHVVAAEEHGEGVSLRLDDGSERRVDHVLLGTGYKVSLARYEFLAPEIVQAVRTVNGYPVLDRGFESSVPGLYFVGATAAHSFGPLCRFVAGTRFTAQTLTKHVRRTAAARALALTPG